MVLWNQSLALQDKPPDAKRSLVWMAGHKMIFLSLQSRGSGLGLSSAHEQNISEFLRFARSKRGQCVKTVETAFQHLADSRLVEDTFTCERGGGWKMGG